VYIPYIEYWFPVTYIHLPMCRAKTSRFEHGAASFNRVNNRVSGFTSVGANDKKALAVVKTSKAASGHHQNQSPALKDKYKIPTRLQISRNVATAWDSNPMGDPRDTLQYVVHMNRKLDDGNIIPNPATMHT